MLSRISVCSFQRTKLTRYTVAVAGFGPYRFSQCKDAQRDDKKLFERSSQKAFFALRGEVLYGPMRPDGYGMTGDFFDKRNKERLHAKNHLRNQPSASLIRAYKEGFEE